MKNVTLLILICTLLSFAGVAQTIPVNGDGTVCKGDVEVYTISPTAGLIYQWTVTEGTITSSSSSSVTVQWTGSGMGLVSVSGVNPGGTEIEGGEKEVSIENAPFITSESSIVCASQAPPPDQPNGDSTECIRVCEGSTVEISANTNVNSVHSWAVVGGNIVSNNGNKITVQWNLVGFGSVTVDVSTNAGCNGSDTRCVEVIQSPVAAFGILPDTNATGVNACTNKELQFKDRSQSNGSPIVSWQWDFGDGNSSTVPNPSHTYADPGVYEAILIVENACHCTSQYIVEVMVEDSAPLEIVCPSVVCENQEAYYSVFDPACAEYDWEVIGGTVSNGATNGVDNIPVVWDSVGPDGFGYVLVYDNYCGSDCEAPTTVKVPVVQSVGSIDGPAQICENIGFQYRLPRWPATEFTWSITGTSSAALFPTDQPNEILVQGEPGTYTLRCVYHNDLINCGGKAIMNISILPQAEMSGPKEVCSDSTYTYKLDSNYVGSWSLISTGTVVATGNGNTFNAAFNSPGDYIVTVSGSSFCSPDPFSVKAKGKPPIPQSISGPDTVCQNIPFTYTAHNSLTGTSFNWAITGGTFPSGTSASSKQVSATFTGSGPYQLKLWRKYKTGLGCISDTLFKTLYPENIDLNIQGSDTACDNTFNAYSTPYRDAETYEWTVVPETKGSIASGNGTKDVQVLWNTVSSPQYVNLVLKARKCGISYYDTLAVWVQPLSGYAITADTVVCGGAGLLLDITSGGVPLSGFSNIVWDFGDGTGASSTTSASIVHVYANTASTDVNYTITATVTEPNNCNTVLTLTHDVLVQPAPVANASPQGPIGICDSASFAGDTLYALVQSGLGSTAGFEWFKNGASLSNFTAKHFYTTAGDYYCVVTGTNGCTDTTNVVNVTYDCSGGGGDPNCPSCTFQYKLPTSLSATNTGCGTVQVNATHSIPNVISEYWEVDGFFEDTTTSPKQVVYTFSQAGTYRVFYSVCYSYDKTAPIDSTCTMQDTIDVINPYRPGIKYDISCGSSGQYSVTLHDHSTRHPNTPITLYEFYVNGSLQQSGSGTAYTTPLAPGSYPIHLRIDGPNYPPCDLYDTLVLPGFPVADFSFDFDGACMGYPIAFTNLSTPATGLSFEWDFNSAAESTVENPFRVFASGGPKAVTLTVRNALGCEHSVTKTVNVTQNLLNATIPTPSPNIVCEGSIITLSANLNPGSSNPDNYIWQPDSFAIVSYPNNTQSVLESGSYFVTLRDSITQCFRNSNSVTVEFVPAPQVQIEGPLDVCQGDSIVLLGTAGTGNYSYQWKRNGSTVSTKANITDYAAGATTYNYELSVTSNTAPGCASTFFHSVVVHAPPTAPAVSWNIVDCQPYTIEMSASAGTAGTFAWSHGDTGASSTAYKGGQYYVEFTDTWGCSSSTTFYVPKSPEEYIWIYPLGCYEVCSLQVVNETWLLPDPIIPFASWNLDGPYSLSGSSSIPDIYLYQLISPSMGTYYYSLANLSCDFQAGAMDFAVEDCDCTFIEAIPQTMRYSTGPGGCRNELDISLNNNTGQTLSIRLQAKHGVIVPSTVIVPPGGITLPFEYIPDGSMLTGGIDTLWARTDIPDGRGGSEPCFFEIPFQLSNPLCGYNGFYKRLISEAGDQDTGSSLVSGLFTLAPNPATNQVSVNYLIQDWMDKDVVSIEVYDLKGARISVEPILSNEGLLLMNTDKWLPSVYIVVLRKNGVLKDYQRLVIKP